MLGAQGSILDTTHYTQRERPDANTDTKEFTMARGSFLCSNLQMGWAAHMHDHSPPSHASRTSQQLGTAYGLVTTLSK